MVTNREYISLSKSFLIIVETSIFELFIFTICDHSQALVQLVCQQKRQEL